MRGFADKLRSVRVVSDSRVVVEQMRGMISVSNPALKRQHARATRQAARFDRVTYIHVPRELNALADAIAGDVLLRRELTRTLELPDNAQALGGVSQAGR